MKRDKINKIKLLLHSILFDIYEGRIDLLGKQTLLLDSTERGLGGSFWLLYVGIGKLLYFLSSLAPVLIWPLEVSDLKGVSQTNLSLSLSFIR